MMELKNLYLLVLWPVPFFNTVREPDQSPVSLDVEGDLMHLKTRISISYSMI